MSSSDSITLNKQELAELVQQQVQAALQAQSPEPKTESWSNKDWQGSDWAEQPAAKKPKQYQGSSWETHSWDASSSKNRVAPHWETEDAQLAEENRRAQAGRWPQHLQAVWPGVLPSQMPSPAPRRPLQNAAD